MWSLSIICPIGWSYSNELISKSHHLIGKLPRVITSHDGFQSTSIAFNRSALREVSDMWFTRCDADDMNLPYGYIVLYKCSNDQLDGGTADRLQRLCLKRTFTVRGHSSRGLGLANPPRSTRTVGSCTTNDSEVRRMRLETLIELKLFNSSFSSLSSYWT